MKQGVAPHRSRGQMGVVAIWGKQREDVNGSQMGGEVGQTGAGPDGAGTRWEHGPHGGTGRSQMKVGQVGVEGWGQTGG